MTTQNVDAGTRLDRIKDLFPLDYKTNKLSQYMESIFNELQRQVDRQDDSRVGKVLDASQFQQLIEKYLTIPLTCDQPLLKCNEIVRDFTQGIVRWRSPNLMYNVGAPTSTPASAVYALALDENIFNINDGLAGASILAEQIVAKILGHLAKLTEQPVGFFTFGGTATNLYAMKLAIKKSVPNSSKVGIPRNVRVLITEDSHFSHSVAADWLGLGTDNVLKIVANKDRTSSLEDAEKKARAILSKGQILSGILLNGGTTYGHTIDDIKSFRELVDTLVADYNLDYTPHIHADTVIGWSWLVFKDYDFEGNPLNIDETTAEAIQVQYNRIANVAYADSWSADFHKGVGSTPVSSSIFIMSNNYDYHFLNKNSSPLVQMHQLAQEYSDFNPSTYTLETSRNSGAALAALTMLHTLGITGLQLILSNLVNHSLFMRHRLGKEPLFQVLNLEGLGYVTMFRILPPSFEEAIVDAIGIEENAVINKYMKTFFDWDLNTRIREKSGAEYSYSSEYMINSRGAKISAFKLYPVSIHFDRIYAETAINTIISQKALFDREVWGTNARTSRN